MYMNDKDIDSIVREALRGEQELPQGLTERLERRIDRLADEEGRKKISPIRKRSLYRLSGIAAALLLGVAIFFQTGQSRTTHERKDTFDDPYEAAIVAHEALALLSAELNKGLEPVSDARKEMSKVSTLINEQFDATNTQP